MQYAERCRRRGMNTMMPLLSRLVSDTVQMGDHAQYNTEICCQVLYNTMLYARLAFN